MPSEPYHNEPQIKALPPPQLVLPPDIVCTALQSIPRAELDKPETYGLFSNLPSADEPKISEKDDYCVSSR